MNLKTDMIDIDTGKHYLRDSVSDAILLSNFIKAGNCIALVMDYDLSPDALRIHFENFNGEGIVEIGNKAYLDDEIVKENMRGLEDNYQEFTYLKESVEGDTIGTDFVETNPAFELVHQYDRHEHFLIHGDPNYYFVVRLEAEWSKTNTDNDANIDFSANNIWAQFVSRPRSTYTTDVSLWTKSFSKECAYVSGTSINIDESFIFEADVQTYVGFNLSDDNTMLMDNLIRPIANYELFWKRITVTRHLKTNWFKTFEIPASANDGVAVKTGDIPSSAPEGLPFAGWYEIHTKVEVKEGSTSGGSDSNVGVKQEYALRPKLGTYRNIDESIAHAEYVIGEDPAVNTSLQGSIMLNLSNATILNRKIQWKVTLPNGTYKQVTGGYIHVKFKGANEGLVRV